MKILDGTRTWKQAAADAVHILPISSFVITVSFFCWCSRQKGLE
jgi:hypothetical protein